MAAESEVTFEEALHEAGWWMSMLQQLHQQELSVLRYYIYSEARSLWERIQSQEHELMELRAEVASLRAQVPETPHASVQPSTPPNDIIDEHLMEDNIIGEHMMKEEDQDEVKSTPPFPPPDQHQNEIVDKHLMGNDITGKHLMNEEDQDEVNVEPQDETMTALSIQLPRPAKRARLP